ncbi:MAG: TlpA disulfide reductase family protein [Bacteroidia bacterium]|nr:TlpA disulfide reductase family protein [Bacteroidia bacterium]
MNRLTLILLITVLIVSCKQEKSTNHIILSGKIEKPSTDSLSIKDNVQKVLHVMKLNDDFTFNDTLEITEGYYSLNSGTESTQLYLKPGFDIHLTFNTDKFDESIAYAGKGAPENNYLAKKFLLVESLGKFKDYQYYGQLEENDYLKLTDSLYNLNMTLFNENSQRFDKEFIYLEISTLKYQKLREQALYETTRRMITGINDFKVSSDYYPRLFKEIDLSNEKLLKISDYIYFVDSYIWQITNNQLNGNDSIDFQLSYLETIEKGIANKKLRQELSYIVGKYRLDRSKKLDKVFEKIKANIENIDYINEIEPKYQTLKKIEKGALSPSFQLHDINEKKIALEDLKGQIVYIDIWSTTCLPCMAEIPHLKKLEESFIGKNIKFVSINVIDSKEHWQETVKEKEMGGIQLFAPDTKVPFFKDYLVRGIPRFILIDKNGRIIDSSAKRPSDPKLKEQIDKLI